jgi:hypothetical protein
MEKKDNCCHNGSCNEDGKCCVYRRHCCGHLLKIIIIIILLAGAFCLGTMFRGGYNFRNNSFYKGYMMNSDNWQPQQENSVKNNVSDSATINVIPIDSNPEVVPVLE